MNEETDYMFGSMDRRPYKFKPTSTNSMQRNETNGIRQSYSGRAKPIQQIERHNQTRNQVSDQERAQQRIEDMKTTARTWVYTGDLQKAIDCFTEVLESEPNDIESLVSRASCHLDLFYFPEAVKDTVAVLEMNSDHAKAHSIKAEAHFQQGEFEDALVHFHRANKLRPNMKENERGIEKAKCAIENSVGESANLRLEKKGDLTYFEEQKNRSRSSKMRRATSHALAKKQDSCLKPREDSKLAAQDQKKKAQKAKTVKQLLGELYGDWQFLDKLLNEEENKLKESNKDERSSDSKRYLTRRYRDEAEKERRMRERVQREYETDGMPSSRSDAPPKKKDISEALRDLALNELKYLDQRTEFWRQNKSTNPSSSARKEDSRDAEFLELLEEIQNDQANGNYAASLDKADMALKMLSTRGTSSPEKKSEYEATVYSLMGTAYYEMEQYKNALKYFKKDLALAKKHKLKDAHSRALDNIGRVYAKTEDYASAIKVFEEKIPMAGDALERTWLHHELGRCYLELKKYKKASEHGYKSLTNAERIDDSSWRLNAHVLIAQALVGQQRYEAALDIFNDAMKIAEEDQDDAAQAAISNAIQDLKERTDDDNDRTDGENDSGQSDTEQVESELKDKDIQETLLKSQSTQTYRGRIRRKLKADEARPEDIKQMIKESNAKDQSEENNRHDNSDPLFGDGAASRDKENGNETPRPRDIAKEIKEKSAGTQKESDSRNDENTKKDDPPKPKDIAAEIKRSNAENKGKEKKDDPLFGGKKGKSSANKSAKSKGSSKSDSKRKGSERDNDTKQSRKQDDDRLFGSTNADATEAKKDGESGSNHGDLSPSKNDEDATKNNSPKKTPEKVPTESDIIAKIKAANEKERKSKEIEKDDFFD